MVNCDKVAARSPKTFFDVKQVLFCDSFAIAVPTNTTSAWRYPSCAVNKPHSHAQVEGTTVTRNAIANSRLIKKAAFDLLGEK